MKDKLISFIIRFIWFVVFIPAGVLSRAIRRDPMCLRCKRGGQGSAMSDIKPDSEMFKKISAAVNKVKDRSEGDANAPDTVYPMW